MNGVLGLVYLVHTFVLAGSADFGNCLDTPPKLGYQASGNGAGIGLSSSTIYVPSMQYFSRSMSFIAYSSLSLVLNWSLAPELVLIYLDLLARLKPKSTGVLIAMPFASSSRFWAQSCLLQLHSEREIMPSQFETPIHISSSRS